MGKREPLKKGRGTIQYCTSKIFVHVLTFGNMGYFLFYLITCDMVVALDVHGNLCGGNIDWNDLYFECN
jgi:hypothetical protein